MRVAESIVSAVGLAAEVDAAVPKEPEGSVPEHKTAELEYRVGAGAAVVAAALEVRGERSLNSVEPLLLDSLRAYLEVFEFVYPIPSFDARVRESFESSQSRFVSEKKKRSDIDLITCALAAETWGGAES